jgi:guanylate kinase
MSDRRALLMERIGETSMSVALERKSGLLLALSAPSGAGKSTITRGLLESDPGMRYSVSVTTRPIRPGEVDGRHYFFVSEGEFLEMISRGEFYEYARVHGNLYGTRKAWIEEQLAKRRDILLDIDVEGGRSIKSKVPSAVLVFILPPSMDALERRLRARGTDDDATIRRRMENARREIAHAGDYDYVVMNDDLDDTLRRLRCIIEAERQRSTRLWLPSATLLTAPTDSGAR